MPSVTVAKCWGAMLMVGALRVALVEGSPNPITGFPDSGVYSLFPQEDLRTGKSIRRRPEEPISRASGFSSRRGGSNRVVFDDERLNFRGHFDSRERPPPETFPGRLETVREQPRHYPSIPIPAYAQSRRPPAAEEPIRINVFNAEMKQRPLLEPLPESLAPYEEVRPGRLFIPGLNRESPFLDVRDPGRDNFINHDEYLDYHTNAAISALQSLERDRESGSREAKRLLFSSQIHGLIPPTTGFTPSPAAPSSFESSSKSSESYEPEVSKSGEVGGKVHISSILDAPPRLEAIKNAVLESGFIPIRNSIPQQQQQPRTPKSDEELPRPVLGKKPSLDVAVSVETSTEAASTVRTTLAPPTGRVNTSSTALPAKRRQFPNVKKSGHVTRILQTHWPGGQPTTTSSPFSIDSTLPTTLPFPFEGTEDSETITFAPSAFDDFIGRRTSSEFAATKIRTEVPLIFLNSQQDLESGKSEKNAIFIKRLKNSRNPVGVYPGTVTRKRPGIQSSMTILHASEDGLGEPSGKFGVTSDEVRTSRSMSSTGIVARVHAHVSKCPKLHSQAEILCDVHIRKRHGSQNPQLVVGWKRKFHNATKEDILLAVNTTLAYIEEDFHDKFNVTLAAGVSPMLRSVLSISHVQPNDTGNYECQVDDGTNKLRSDTLLFLCH